jgi:GT2 family glycosyltransferase
LPFKWVWGSTNRGFSGANNLGAAHSRAPVLAFLNSDAFPQQPGWLQTLIAELHGNPSFGAVAPRLVFGDGSMQHAGMAFVRRDEWGIWINHHPRMGLAPSLDPHTHTTTVPAVTGACLVIERDTFDAAGAWDTGYLIGDFEDSDLCLKLRANGLRVAYVPRVQLTHLERQSFKLLGQDDFRQKVVVYNAVRHQSRWADALLELGQAL